MDLNELSYLHPDLSNILLDTCVASWAVEEKDPKHFLESESELAGIQHEIRNICVSRDYTEQEHTHYLSELPEVKYLIANDDKNKRLIIAFKSGDYIHDKRLNRFSIDFFRTNIFHSILQLAEHIPIDYFIEKLMDDYDVVFTGHSFGAIIGVVITLKLLQYTPEDRYRKVLFVGYGCPSILNIFLKDDLQNSHIYKDRFIFIKNKEDIIVEILDYLAILTNQRLMKGLDNLNILRQFVASLLPFMIGAFDEKKLVEVCKNFRGLLQPIHEIDLPKYEHFGTLLQLNQHCQLVKVDKFHLSNMENLFRQEQDNLIAKIKFHLIRSYFQNLKMKIFKTSTVEASSKRVVNTFNEFFDEKLEISSIDFRVNQNSTEIYVKLKTDNLDYLVAANLVIREIKSTEIKSTINKSTEIKSTERPVDDVVKFTCSNNDLWENDKIRNKNLKLKFYLHFNEAPIEKDVHERLISSEIKEKITQKYAQIQDMPFDLLYLHAVFYIHLVTKMEKKENLTKANQDFIAAKNKLKEIFYKIDQLADLNINDRLWGKDELENIFKSYLEYQISDYEQNNNDMGDMYKNIQFKSDSEKLEYCNFEKIFIKIDKLVENSEPNLYYEKFEELLKLLIPYIYEIRKLMCRSSQMSEEILSRLALNDNSFTIKTLKILKSFSRYGSETAGLLTSTPFMMLPSVSIPLSKMVKDRSKDITERPIGRLINKIVRNNLIQENDNYLYRLILVSIVNDKSSKNMYLGDLEKKIDVNKIIKSWEENDSFYYHFIIPAMLLISPILIYKNEINSWTVMPIESDRKKFKIMQLNSEIRDILCKNCLIGVIGTKKAGKSTFIELITNKNAQASASQATTFAHPYSLSQGIALIDYPHFNSSTLSHKIEFYFTRLFIDHVVLLFDAKMKGETKDETLLYNLVARNYFKNFTIFYNHTDFFFRDNGVPRLYEFKEAISKKLDLYSLGKIYFTCLDDKIENLKKKDQMIDASVYLKDKVIKKFNQILNNIIDRDESTGNEVTQHLPNNSQKVLIKTKEVSISLKKKEIKYTLHRDEIDDNQDYTHFSSFDDFVKELSAAFRLNEKKFTITSHDSKQMKSIEDFFENDFYSFQLDVENN